jgi:DNA-binding winged helix-turn-helix (wHTH) protein/formylglycine-generating enzyme required for sulfatase activity
MATGPESDGKLRFAAFAVDLRAGELLKRGRKIHLQELPFRILAALLECPGDVVTREELRQKLWPDDTFVDFEHGLNTAVNKLRAALNDSADTPRYIETLPRRGYRFIGSAEGQGESAISTRTIQMQLAQVAPQADPEHVRSRLRPAVRIAMLILIALLVGLSALLFLRGSRERWAHNVALPEVSRLIEEDQLYAAYRAAEQAEKFIPQDPQLRYLLARCSGPVLIRTTPPGAEVYIRDYLAEPASAGWELLGRSPLERVRVPFRIAIRLTKDGYEPVEKNILLAASLGPGFPLDFMLHKRGTVPPGTVFVPGGTYELFSAQPVELADYWLDKYEVTNTEYKAFVDAGGYRKKELWKYPIYDGGKRVSWEEAMAHFRDATGRPGPATWKFGAIPEGQADFPVGGVSWYEAAAYAEAVGKTLPTVYHWYNGASLPFATEIIRLANFSGHPAPVGSHRSMGLHGAYDMAGNVKEWCWNDARGRRFILGGAWNEPSYFFWDPYTAPPWDRLPGYGFRCVRYIHPPDEKAMAPIEYLARDFRREKPAADDVFRIYRSLYSYNRGELDARVEETDDTHPAWRREKVSFKSAYGSERVPAYLYLRGDPIRCWRETSDGSERVPAYLYLPRNVARPLQNVIWFGGANILLLPSSENFGYGPQWFDVVIRSGRAVLCPVYKGTFERRYTEGIPPPANDWRDLLIYWSKDLGRSIDYIESRPDLDATTVAYYGISMGGSIGPILIAVENRVKTGIFLGGGMLSWRMPPESEQINFAPRVRVPILMLNGRDDFSSPVYSSQVPMLDLLGTPKADKRHVIFDSGHIPPVRDVMKEVVGWLDRYLGPVGTAQGSAHRD